MAIPLFPKSYRTDGASVGSIQFEDWFNASQQTTGDYIVIVVTNNGGATTLTIDVGWNRLGSVDAPNNSASRCGVFWRKNTGTLLTSPTINGTVDSWRGVAFVVRDAPDVADETWIDGYVRTDQTTSTLTPSFPAITTTVADCLIVKIVGFDAGGLFMPAGAFFNGTVIDAGSDNATTNSPSVTSLVTANHQPTIATVSAEQVDRAVSDGGTLYTIAIKNKVGGALPARVTNGGGVTQGDSMTVALPSIIDPSTIITDIEGVTVAASTNTSSFVQQATTSPIYGPYRNVVCTPPASVCVFGRLLALNAPTDLSDGKLAVMTIVHALYTQLSALGMYWVFVDSLNNWNAYRLQGKAAGAIFKTIMVNLADETIVDSSTVPADLTDIAYWGPLFHNTVASAVGRSASYRSFYSIDTTTPALILTGGNAVRPVTPLDVANALNSGAIFNTVGIQGGVQILTQLSPQIGDGTTPTAFRGEGFSYALPLVGGIETYRVGAGLQSLKIKTSASDVIDMSSMTLASETEHIFAIDAASNPAASYTAPSVIRGFAYTPKVGIDTVGATFTRCPKIIGGGATFDGCTFKRTTATDATLRLSTGGEAIACKFERNGEDYAIELLDAGTYDLTGAEFTGYTDDLHILAVSGTVTITLATGQPEPTYVSAGASIVWDQAVLSSTAAVDWTESGSTVQVYNETTTTEIYVAAAIVGTSWSLAYVPPTSFSPGDVVRVRIRKAGFEPIESTVIVGASGWGVFGNQVADPHWGGLAPTNVTVDYGNKKIRATGARTSFSAQELADIIRTAEATLAGIMLPDFADVTGLVELSPGVTTALTVNLLGWQASWAAASVAQATIGGGNVVGGLAGDPVEDVVGGPQVTVNVSAAATQVSSGGSIPTAEDNAAAVWAYVTRTLTSSGAGLTAQETRDAMLLAPTGGGAAGSIDTVLGVIKAKTDALPSDPADASDVAAAIAAIPAAPSAATVAGAVRTELATELARVDVATSTRLAAAGYTAPDNAGVAAIKAKTDALPTDPADQSLIVAAIAAIPAAPSAVDNAAAVRTNLATEMGRLDVATSTRLAAAGYTAPDNAGVAAINARLPSDPADASVVAAQIAAIPAAPTAAAVAAAVRSDQAVELARIDLAISSRNAVAPDNAGIAGITATLAGPVAANVVRVNGLAVDGTGTDGDPWGPA